MADDGKLVTFITGVRVHQSGEWDTSYRVTTITCCWLAKGPICDGCSRQSVICCPALGQISKSKRDRLETRRPSHHRTLLGNWHQRFCCRIQLLPLRRCHWRYSGFKYKMCAYIKILILYYCLYYCLFILCVFLLYSPSHGSKENIVN